VRSKEQGSMKKEVIQHFGQVILHDLSPEPPPAPSTGSCTMVDAGPGDPNWLTVHVVLAIQAATFLLVEERVSDEVVALASPMCRVVRFDRRSGRPPMPQAVIDKLILHAVHEGHQVVRLRGRNPSDSSCVEQDVGTVQTADLPTRFQPS
jgi:uroporphyrin-III C-methyltransferase